MRRSFSSGQGFPTVPTGGGISLSAAGIDRPGAMTGAFEGIPEIQVEGDSNRSNASSSWYSRQSSRVDMSGALARGDSVGGGVGGGLGGSSGGGGGGGWLGRIGGGVTGGGGSGTGAGEREKIVTVLVTDVEADRVEIVEVARAVVVE